MPVIVIGADTPAGDAIVDALLPNAVEVRVFISDEDRTAEFKRRGTKVATGDVSDASHVEGAALRCFCAVLVVEAAHDARPRAFAGEPESVVAGWAAAAREAAVQRVIWVGSETDRSIIPELDAETAFVSVETAGASLATRVADLEGRSTLDGEAQA